MREHQQVWILERRAFVYNPEAHKHLSEKFSVGSFWGPFMFCNVFRTQTQAVRSRRLMKKTDKNHGIRSQYRLTWTVL